jgi:hypothetical protein
MRSVRQDRYGYRAGQVCGAQPFGPTVAEIIDDQRYFRCCIRRRRHAAPCRRNRCREVHAEPAPLRHGTALSAIES